MKFNIFISITLSLALMLPLTPGSAVAVSAETPALSSPAEKGSSGPVSPGSVTIEAESISYDQETDTYHASRHVVITYDSGVLTADDVFLNKTKNEALATGNVTLKSNNDILEGDRVDFDIETKTGVAYQGKVFIAQNHFYLSGDKIEKRGESTYHVEGAVATTCDGDAPDWQLTGNELDVTMEGHGTLTHMKFLTNGMPILYMPYLIFPAKTKRQSGFLFPYLAYSNKLGWDMELPFFWAISDSMDATFYQRYMDMRGFKEGVELRYFTSRDNFGTFYGDFLNDSVRINETIGGVARNWQSDQQRWSVYLNHQTTFDPTFSFRADIRKVSDSWYFRDFSSHNYYLDNYSTTENQRFKKVPFLGDDSLSSLESTARLVKNWSLYNLTILGSYTDNFATQSNDATLQKYPEITLIGIKRPLLGTPLNLEFSTSYDYYYRTTGQRGHLYDVKPYLSLPLNLGGYGQLTPQFGVEGTVWQRDDDQPVPSDKQGNRGLYTAALNLRTEIHRIFDVNSGPVQKIRHGIVPEVTYTYVPDVNQDSAPDFLAKINGQSTLMYALTNSFVAKVLGRDGKPSYREFLRLKLAQTYDIKEATRDVPGLGTDRKPFSDVDLEVDFLPFQYLSFLARNKYGVYATAWTQANYDLTLSDSRGDSATLAYRYTQNSYTQSIYDQSGYSRYTQSGIEEINLALKAVVTKTTDLIYFQRRDQFNQRDVEKKFSINYHKQCWNVEIGYAEKVNATATGDQYDKTFMIAFSLYGLGKVGGW
jgi:LPS-assembly protein